MKRFIVFTLSILALIYIVLLFIGGGLGYKTKCPIVNCNDTIIYAYRGMKGLPENGMDAFIKAIDYGFPGLELDIRVSKDNELMVVHDENLKRLINLDTTVNELSSEYLTKMPIYHNGEPSTNCVLTLDSVLSVLGNKALLFLDI